ncbi:MAG: hypothetical protein V1676_01945 [Candidatus Diapherotrites archaeon]
MRCEGCCGKLGELARGKNPRRKVTEPAAAIVLVFVVELNYDEIRRIHRLEKSSSRLVELEAEFYTELNAFLQKEKKEYLESLKSFSVSKARNFTNLRKMVEEIFLMREKKIVAKALAASRSGEAQQEGMPLPEQKLFAGISSVLAKHGTLLEGAFSEHASKGAKGAAKGQETVKMKISDDIPAFVGTDMNEYGPYAAKQTVELPQNIASLLSARNLGVILKG